MLGLSSSVLEIPNDCYIELCQVLIVWSLFNRKNASCLVDFLVYQNCGKNVNKIIITRV